MCLEKEFESSKNYKSELKWFEGVWSRFKPGLGKDKRGVSGVKKSELIEIGKNIYHILKTTPYTITVNLQIVHKVKCPYGIMSIEENVHNV